MEVGTSKAASAILKSNSEKVAAAAAAYTTSTIYIQIITSQEILTLGTSKMKSTKVQTLAQFD